MTSESSLDELLLHHNSFIDNNLIGTSQAYDRGANNLWYDAKKKKGNYWSDWNKTGSYSIDGSADSFDLYPLNKIPKKINFNYLMIFPAVILIAIIRKRYKK